MQGRYRNPRTGARATLVVVLACVLSAAVGAHPSAPRAAAAEPAVSPGVYRTIASGIARFRTYSCTGRALGRGTAFLVGRSVAMTTRRSLAGACTVQVTVAGRTVTGSSWAILAAKGVSDAATDLATIKLASAAAGAHVFRFRSASLPTGTPLAAAGYRAGAKPTLAQGTLAWSGARAGAPLLAVKAGAAAGVDGAPLFDDEGLVAGIVQVGRGARDVPGSKTGVVEGLDLVRWWGLARADLCRVYVKGGIPSCASSTPDPTPDPTPSPARRRLPRRRPGPGRPRSPSRTPTRHPARRAHRPTT